MSSSKNCWLELKLIHSNKYCPQYHHFAREGEASNNENSQFGTKTTVNFSSIRT